MAMNRAFKRFVCLLSPLVLLQACGNSEPEAPAASVEVGLERSVADVRAAERAASGPAAVNPSVGDLSGKDDMTGKAGKAGE